MIVYEICEPEWPTQYRDSAQQEGWNMQMVVSSGHISDAWLQYGFTQFAASRLSSTPHSERAASILSRFKQKEVV